MRTDRLNNKRNLMLKNILLAAMVVILALSCQDEQYVMEKDQSGIIIQSGTICGWCSLNDTLTISGTFTRYVNYTQCNNNQPTVEKMKQIAASEVDSLWTLLDFAELKKIDLNTCNICFDGCDDWLYVNNGKDSHYIRFTRNDPKLQPIQAFLDRLNAIKTNN